MLGKSALQGAEQKNNERRRGTGAHQADTPDFSGQWSEASTDLNIEFRQEVFASGSLVDAIRNAHGVEGPETLALRRQNRQPKFLQALEESVMISFMASPARLEPFFFDECQCLVQRLDERRGHRVVVLAPNPLVFEQ